MGWHASHLHRWFVDVRARPPLFVGVVAQLDTHRCGALDAFRREATPGGSCSPPSSAKHKQRREPAICLDPYISCHTKEGTPRMLRLSSDLAYA